MSKKGQSLTCVYCQSPTSPVALKCNACGEWLGWCFPRMISFVGQAIVVLSFIVLIWQFREAQRLQEITAVSSVLENYAELDRYLIDKPELQSLIADADSFGTVQDELKTADGRTRLQEAQFVAYLLDIFETEFFLREYGVYPRGGEFVLDKVLSNPRMAEWWFEDRLRDWYSPEFRAYTDAKIRRPAVRDAVR